MSNLCSCFAGGAFTFTKESKLRAANTEAASDKAANYLAPMPVRPPAVFSPSLSFSLSPSSLSFSLSPSSLLFASLKILLCACSACLLLLALQGKVLKVLVRDGQEVDAGVTLLTMESMKTEMKVHSASKGVVRVFVKEGDLVEQGQRLVDVQTAVGEQKKE